MIDLRSRGVDIESVKYCIITTRKEFNTINNHKNISYVKLTELTWQNERDGLYEVIKDSTKMLNYNLSLETLGEYFSIPAINKIRQDTFDLGLGIMVGFKTIIESEISTNEILVLCLEEDNDMSLFHVF